MARYFLSNADGATGTTLRDYVWLPANDNGNDAPGGALADALPQLAGGGAGTAEGAPPDLPLAVVDGVNTASPVTYQVHTDHLGRPIRMTDAAKATVLAASWKPRGEPVSLTGTAVNNLRFPGQYFQIETGFAYNWHRTYDPVTGRYTQPDPLRFVDGSSIYAYAGNSPFMARDREGLELAGGARNPNCRDQGLLSRLFRGRAAHNAFYVAIDQNTDPSRQFHTDSAVGGLFDGRPDLYESNGATWELKSTAYGGRPLYAKVQAQLKDYLSSAPNSFKGSWSSLFGDRKKIESGGFIFEPDTPSDSGLIFYSCKPPPQMCPSGQALTGLPRF